MTTAQAAFKAEHKLVTVTYNGIPYRYTNQSQQIGPYVSVPNMGIDPAIMRGTLDPEVWTLELPFDALAADLLDHGTKQQASVTIQSVLSDSRLSNTKAQIKHSGILFSVQKEPDNKRGWVRYTVSNDKEMLARSPSYRLRETCPNTLFGNGCTLSEEAHTFPGTLISFNHLTRVAVITGFPLPEPLLYFTQGRLRRLGTVVDIRFWTKADPQVFYTTQLLPSSWLNQEIALTAGCIRTVEACEGFNNLLNFNGIGRKVPKYNPQYETGE